jgi:hypothetical protein
MAAHTAISIQDYSFLKFAALTGEEVECLRGVTAANGQAVRWASIAVAGTTNRVFHFKLWALYRNRHEHPRGQ